MDKASKRHIPLRSCISCREKRGKRELFRLVIHDGGMVVWDEFGKGRGRGAYVCPRKSCLENIERGNRLNRAFRKKGMVTLHPESFMAMHERERPWR
jgi:predicted RNA-binding protein YlxR (DUF448 family)